MLQAHALLTASVTYKPTNISNSPIISLSDTGAYTGNVTVSRPVPLPFPVS